MSACRETFTWNGCPITCSVPASTLRPTVARPLPAPCPLSRWTRSPRPPTANTAAAPAMTQQSSRARRERSAFRQTRVVRWQTAAANIVWASRCRWPRANSISCPWRNSARSRPARPPNARTWASTPATAVYVYLTFTALWVHVQYTVVQQCLVLICLYNMCTHYTMQALLLYRVNDFRLETWFRRSIAIQNQLLLWLIRNNMILFNSFILTYCKLNCTKTESWVLLWVHTACSHMLHLSQHPSTVHCM